MGHYAPLSFFSTLGANFVGRRALPDQHKFANPIFSLRENATSAGSPLQASSPFSSNAPGESRGEPSEPIKNIHFKLRQNRQRKCDFRLVAEWRKQMLTRSFSLKKAKTSQNAVFATGADNGSRTHLSGLGSPHTTDVLYPHISLVLFLAQYFFIFY